MKYYYIISFFFQFLTLGALYSIAHDMGVIKIWIIRITDELKKKR